MSASGTMQMPVLSTKALSISFGALNVVKSVDFALGRGARHALIGPNGAGKTTFINLLSGVLRPTKGTVSIGSEDVTALSLDKRVRYGLVRTFQITQLFRSMTVFENVSMAILNERRHGMALFKRCQSFRHVTESAIEVLDRLRLGGVAFRRVSELSYGTQRLVELAMALAMRPKILLLDEPLAGIPVRERQPIFEVIGALDRELAILIVEHDIEFVIQFAEVITVLAHGSVLAQGSPAEIVENQDVMESYLGKSEHA
jgi:branched-chain amino acid transport system ATP-binding protein